MRTHVDYGEKLHGADSKEISLRGVIVTFCERVEVINISESGYKGRL